MVYLHKNIEEFRNAVNLASERYHVLPAVVEKDYYVTIILRGLSEKLGFVVFKGGTSLSKCHRVIKRFSEDIDITIDAKLSQSQMKTLKETIKTIAEEIGLSIPNLEATRSRRSYNQYVLAYESVANTLDDVVQSEVLLETSFAEISFPTVILPVYSYIGDMMEEEAPNERTRFQLDPFEMKVQAIDRTLVDKVFAICDYYMQDKVKKHSRHIYDIYKLLPLVPQTEGFKDLIQDVRRVRAMNSICTSAQPGVDITELLRNIIDSEAYKSDYESVTTRILDEQISYNVAIQAVRTIADTNLFAETSAASPMSAGITGTVIVK